MRSSLALCAAALLACLPALTGCQSSLTAGKLYIQQEQYDKAREQLELAVAEKPGNAEGFFHLGRVCGLLGDYPAMADAFDRAQELGGKFDEQIADERRRYGSRIYNEGVAAAGGATPDLEAARGHFALAVRVLPDELMAWRNLAVVDYQLGDLDGAVSGFEHVVSQAPDDTSTYRMLGTLYLSRQSYDEAARCFEAVLEHGEHQGALVHLAMVHMDQDRPAEAGELVQRALAINPDCFDCHFTLGNLHWAGEEFAVARGHFERAVALDDGNADARFNLAVTYLALEELDLALPLLERLSVELPENAAVWRELGRIYALRSRIQESETAYERAEALGQ